jgi:hypothetical protein
VVVNHVIAGSPAEGKIEKGDRVLSVNGHTVDDNGTIEFRPDERTDYNYLVEMNQLGDRIDVEVLREGKKRAVALRLDKTKGDFLLIPGEQYDQNPRYFIFGGVVFSPLTKNFLNAWKHPPEELVTELSSWPTGDRKEIVIALMVLPDTVNRGYEKLNSWMIDTVNGRGFSDFDEFFELVTTSTEPYVIFKDKKRSEVIIDSREAEESHQRILQTYSIRKDRSPDLARLHAQMHQFAERYQ